MYPRFFLVGGRFLESRRPSGPARGMCTSDSGRAGDALADRARTIQASPGVWPKRASRSVINRRAHWPVSTVVSDPERSGADDAAPQPPPSRVTRNGTAESRGRSRDGASRDSRSCSLSRACCRFWSVGESHHGAAVDWLIVCSRLWQFCGISGPELGQKPVPSQCQGSP